MAASPLLHQSAKTMIAFIKLPRESYERMWLKARLKSIDEMKVRKYQMKHPKDSQNPKAAINFVGPFKPGIGYNYWD
jgi:hypothetical protein